MLTVEPSTTEQLTIEQRIQKVIANTVGNSNLLVENGNDITNYFPEGSKDWEDFTQALEMEFGKFEEPEVQKWTTVQSVIDCIKQKPGLE